MDEVERFRRRLVEEALRRRLFGPRQRVLVALSGGPDSSALLDALAAVRQIWPLRLYALYVDHGLRPESAGEARFCRELTAARGIPLAVRRVDVRGLAARPGWSLESAARELRLRALREEAWRLGAERVALGHQADDRAETVLMRLLRGAGRGGLGAMSWQRPPFVRPLLAFRREETRAYCRAAGIEAREDATNLDPRFFRNRIRLELLPALERTAPGLRWRLWRLAEILSDEEAWLEELTRARLPELLDADGRLDRRGFRRLPPAAQRRLLRLLAGAPPRQLDFDRLEAARRALLGGRPRRVELGGGRLVEVEGERAAVRDAAARERGGEDGPRAPAAGTVAWTLPPGSVLLWRAPGGGFWRFRLAGPAPRPGEPEPGWRPLWLDAARLAPGGLAVRAPRRGDLWWPAGLGAARRLLPALKRNGLERGEWEGWPVVLHAGRPLWSPGLVPDQRLLARAGAPAWALYAEPPPASGHGAERSL